MNNISVEPISENVFVSVSAPKDSVSVSFYPTENPQIYSELAKNYCNKAAYYSNNAVAIIQNTVDNIESGLVNSVNAVASDLINIDAVNANKTNIDTVVSNLSEISTISENLTNISAVNSNKTNIDTVATNMSNVNSVINNITSINTVANNINIIDDLALEIDRIDQSKGKESGSVSTNADILADVKKYAHSAFERSRFSTVTGTPVITDGILTFANKDNYLKSSNPVDVINKSVKIKLRIKTPSDFNSATGYFSVNEGGNPQFRVFIRTSGNMVSECNNGHTMYLTSTTALATSTWYDVEMILTSENFTATAKELISGSVISFPIGTNQDGLLSKVINPYFGFTVQDNVVDLRDGAIDMVYSAIYADDVLIFSGYKNGTDTYTTGGNTVEIPYLLSKTGSKIVDSVYRTQVTAVYNEFGYAPYYTLGYSDFTLPMGEIYGIIGSKTLRESYRNGVDYWEIYSDNTLEQGGICTSGTEVVLLKAYKDTNYILTVPYSAKTTTSFTPSQSGCWIAKGVY